MQPKLPLTDLLSERGRWLKELSEQEQAAAKRLEQAYLRLIADGMPIDLAMRAIVKRLAELEADEQPSPQDLQDLREMQNLIAVTRAELDDFRILYQAEALSLSNNALESGQAAALRQATAQVDKVTALEVADIWNTPSPQAIANLADIVDNPVWRANQNKFSAKAADMMSDTILSLVAQGKSSRFIARQLSNSATMPYAWALNTVRTAQVYSYRAASHYSYANNARILDGWIWSSSLDSVTCISCISQHGKMYDVTQTLNDHHRGRCTPLPVVKGTKWRDNFVSGETWYYQQNEETRRAQVNNNKLFDAIESGEVPFNKLSVPYQDSVFGEMLRQTTYKEAVRK